MELIFTGDLILDEPRPDHWLSGIAPALRNADLTIGHLEVPHTAHVEEVRDDVPAPGADPAHLAALARAGIGAVTLAGNHIADLGAVGIADTVRGLAEVGIAYTGAGATLAEARKPAIIARGGKRIAVLSYNCVGPESSWAGPDRAGCSYIRVEAVDGGPIRPAAALDRIDPASLATLAEDIEAAKAKSDVVVVAFHKGIVHTRARLAPYERPLARAAVEAGCDVVIGHHAHIVRGIEFYKGVPIFHGLGNGCVVTRALSPDQASPERAAWARKRKELFGFEPDPAYLLAPFHPEAVNALLGRLHIDANGKVRAGFIPVHVDPPGRPRIAPDAAQRIADYVQAIGIEAGLPPLTMQITSEGVWLS
ncbi:MAG TPA: CapA family protein [Steroidobacter sp.]|uniref:CapA family protein n=1 Tax=Steroidobacter sp. TaxID=1978227 RepID=UPI002EDB36AA